MEEWFVFFVGTIFGSFLNVCIYRIPRKLSLFSPGSFCPHCGIHIPFYYNIPVVSFIFLRGKCYYCDSPISPRYPFVELLTGFLTLVTFVKFGISSEFLFYLVFIYFLIVISFIDLSTQLIYNKLLLYLLGSGLILNLLFHVISWWDALTGMLAGGGVMFSLALLGNLLFRKESLGMGDVKLAAVAGFFLGWKMILFALFGGFFIAFLVILLLALLGKLKMGEYVPLGPFLALGIVAFVYWGPLLINWYWRLFITMPGK